MTCCNYVVLSNRQHFPVLRSSFWRKLAGQQQQQYPTQNNWLQTVEKNWKMSLEFHKRVPFARYKMNGWCNWLTAIWLILGRLESWQICNKTKELTYSWPIDGFEWRPALSSLRLFIELYSCNLGQDQLSFTISSWYRFFPSAILE